VREQRRGRLRTSLAGVRPLRANAPALASAAPGMGTPVEPGHGSKVGFTVRDWTRDAAKTWIATDVHADLFATILRHELGHALGLEHFEPHDGDLRLMDRPAPSDAGPARCAGLVAEARAPRLGPSR
jgi:hypothetical protein